MVKGAGGLYGPHKSCRSPQVIYVMAHVQEADEAGKAGSSSLSASELLEVLKGDYKMDDIPQSGVVSEEVGTATSLSASRLPACLRLFCWWCWGVHAEKGGPGWD